MLTRLEISECERVLNGTAFGSVGPYEVLGGSAWFAVDPAHPLNKPIVDLKSAPTDATGKVVCRSGPA